MINLKIARVKNNLTQKQLAELVGVSSSTINRIETGKQVLKVDMLNKLVNILEIPINDLLEVK
ncbi:helix-turn-helix transcriptional regulator [Romboutsia lituseburensis]|uniref:helix-turn-helix transcriptional regulator n=1 Tax=Romboutsia lituseburensis TaxID=1537 RepID=UPI00215B5A84|nr:helix-turn-helix domain-containing protein [Romboutsia lituseburensis]MCR8746212.1 helix-turn-helix domain-containing protein [Romboutsia lituseburensis]